MDVSSRLISVSNVSWRACRDTRVYRRAFSMPTAIRDANRRQQPLVFFGKGAGLSGFHVDHTDDFVLDDERDSEFGAYPGRGVDEVLFRGDIVHQNCFAPLHRASRNALPDFDTYPIGDFGRVPHLKANP